MWRVLAGLWMCAVALRLLSPEVVGATHVPGCSGHGMELSWCAKADEPVILLDDAGCGRWVLVSPPNPPEITFLP